MITSGLLISSFYLRKRYSREEEKIALNSYEIGNQKNDFNVINYLNEFMLKYTNYIDDDKSMKVFSVERGSIIHNEKTDYRFISCIIKSGSYGIESDITDRLTDEVVYTKQYDDADVKKFRCLFYVPKNKKNFIAKKGIIVFQTIGNYGVKTITLKLLRNFFADADLTFETRCISVVAFLKEILSQDKLKKVSFIKNVMSSDDSDNIYVNRGKEVLTYVNPHLKSNVLQSLIDLIERKSHNEQSIIEIDDKFFSDIKLTFKIKESQKTVSLSKIDKFSIIEDIPDNVYRMSVHDGKILVEYILDSIKDYIEYINMHEEIMVRL